MIETILIIIFWSLAYVAYLLALRDHLISKRREAMKIVQGFYDIMSIDWSKPELKFAIRMNQFKYSRTRSRKLSGRSHYHSWTQGYGGKFISLLIYIIMQNHLNALDYLNFIFLFSGEPLSGPHISVHARRNKSARQLRRASSRCMRRRDTTRVYVYAEKIEKFVALKPPKYAPSISAGFCDDDFLGFFPVVNAEAPKTWDSCPCDSCPFFF